MDTNRPYLIMGVVVLLVFTIGMLLSHPSLQPTMSDARAWLSDERDAWNEWAPYLRI